MAELLLTNIGELLSLAPLAASRRFHEIQESDLGLLKNAWLATQDGKILDFGSGVVPLSYKNWNTQDVQGAFVMPGLVDCHTHPLFAEDRSHEFVERLNGKSYQDIAARGGGIKSTIRSTRAAVRQTLKAKTRHHLERFLRWGVTTVEAKTGYGQSPESELEHLRILRELANEGPQTLQLTCLALHDLPSDCKDKQSFVQSMVDELLPTVAKEGLADWVDGFVENGYFSVDDARPFFEKARSLGLRIRLHADEFSQSGSALAAAAWGAASADHLQHASETDALAMSAAGTVAVLLPGTSFYTKIPYTRAETFRKANCTIAVASDFNPGSCYLPNLPLAASLAALYCGLSAPETLAAVTLNAARALRLEDRKGALAVGYDADLVVHELKSHQQWLADFGQTLPSQVFIRGQLIPLHP